jgi:ribonucleoside-triphosphate reductase
MQVVKRDGSLQEFDSVKIVEAISKAFDACCPNENRQHIENMVLDMHFWDGITIEEIQDIVVETLKDYGYDEVAESYSSYRKEQSHYRELIAKINYQDKYVTSTENAATSSETDGNANVVSKNVATLESEDRKRENREIQRYRMKKQLKKMFPEVASQYAKDLNSHIIYTHDEASTSVLKQYCMAVSLYPLMLEGVGNIDGVTPSEPNDLQSFSGQVTNLIFLLSSQCKGAVAVGSYFIALNYYIIKEYGPEWYNKLDCIVTSDHSLIRRTLRDSIYKAFKQFVWGINQPAGNRSYQSPFTNVSYYDKTYFESMFGEFYYPDGSQPEWRAIDTVQRLFMDWFNKVRLKQVLTFPVETFAMVHDGTDIIDKEYKDLCAEMYAKGHSFFTYISDSADSLASCCRLRNEVSENTFSPTSGLTGVKTGSCNVISLNMNRIVQNFAKLNPTLLLSNTIS